MAPFTSMLKVRRGRKQRPITPPSPGSFYAPRSPPAWNKLPTMAELQVPRSRSPAAPGILINSGTQDRERDNNANNANNANADAGPSYSAASHPYAHQAEGSNPNQEDDALEQISSFSFPLPPTDTFRPGATVRFVDRNRPLPNFKVSLNLAGQGTLEDMLLASGMISEGEAFATLAEEQALELEVSSAFLIGHLLPPWCQKWEAHALDVHGLIRVA